MVHNRKIINDVLISLAIGSAFALISPGIPFIDHLDTIAYLLSKLFPLVGAIAGVLWTTRVLATASIEDVRLNSVAVAFPIVLSSLLALLPLALAIIARVMIGTMVEFLLISLVITALLGVPGAGVGRITALILGNPQRQIPILIGGGGIGAAVGFTVGLGWTVVGFFAAHP